MSNRRRGGQGSDGALLLASIVAGLVLALIGWVCWTLGSSLAGLSQRIPINPLAAVAGLVKGTLVWPLQATILGGAAVIVVAVAATVCAVSRPTRRGSDRAARTMARPAELTEITGRSARDKAARLRPGADLSTPGSVGLRIGTTVAGGVPLYVSWEDVGTVLAGPRMGKTHSVVIPAICDAPGAVVTTSNKADVHHHTRGVREQRGRVWVSDLQGIAGPAGQQWWWNPLAGITSLARARRMAGYFSDAATTAGSTSNDYFDGGSQDLLALHILAAACADGDLLHVLEWLSDDRTDGPAQILIAHGHEVPAMSMRQIRALNDRQRDGLFDMARRYLAALSEPTYAQAVTPPRRQMLNPDGTLGEHVDVHDLPEFDPTAFVTGTDTLYALSKEGRDSAAALSTALVGRVFEAAETLARRSAAGRLPTPLVAVLDEAANICKLSELPDQYSHFGSQGIVVLTVLQSPAQARKVWTADQFDALLSASNVHIYGGGITDSTYLSSLSQQVGDHDVSRWSTSRGRGDRSTSQSWSREAILPVDELAALPKDRALVMTSGNPPVLVRKAFWQNGPHAENIRSSLARFDRSPADRNPLLPA